jgi:hypothetical protein
MLGLESLGNMLGIGTTFTPVLNFLGAFWLWVLNMVDGFLFDLGQLGLGFDLFGLTSAFS